VKILAKPALPHSLSRSMLCCDECARRQPMSLTPTDAAEGPALEDLQELGCSVRSSSPTSSRNSAPPSATSTSPFLSCFASGEGTALVAERASDSKRGLGELCTVDSTKGALAPPTALVNQTGHDTFAGALSPEGAPSCRVLGHGDR